MNGFSRYRIRDYFATYLFLRLACPAASDGLPVPGQCYEAAQTFSDALSCEAAESTQQVRSVSLLQTSRFAPWNKTLTHTRAIPDLVGQDVDMLHVASENHVDLLHISTDSNVDLLHGGASETSASEASSKGNATSVSHISASERASLVKKFSGWFLVLPTAVDASVGALLVVSSSPRGERRDLGTRLCIGVILVTAAILVFAIAILFLPNNIRIGWLEDWLERRNQDHVPSEPVPAPPETTPATPENRNVEGNSPVGTNQKYDYPDRIANVEKGFNKKIEEDDDDDQILTQIAEPEAEFDPDA